MIGRARVDATSGRNDAASRVDARPVGSIGRLGSVRARPNRCGRPIDATTGPNDWAPESIRTRPQSTRPLATIGASPNRKIGLLIGTPSKRLGRAQLIGAGPRQCESSAIAKYDRPKFRILSAKRGGQTRLPCSSLLFTYILMPLSGASARALLVTPSFSRPMWLRYAPVRRSAAANSSRIALTVSLC